MPNVERFIHFTPGEVAQVQPLLKDNLLLTGRAQEVGQVKIEIPPEALHDVLAAKQAAITHVYRALNLMNNDLKGFFIKVTDALPAVIDGILLNPDGLPAERVSVEALAPVYTQQEIAADKNLAAVSWSTPQDTTDARGGFKLNLPSVPAPENGLRLMVRGGNATFQLDLKRVMLIEGQLGVLPLGIALTPLRTSIVAQLKGIQSDILATSPEDVANRPNEFAAPAPQLTLGQGDCARFFRSNSGVIDSFRYSVLIRMIEPQMNQWQPIFRFGLEGDRFIPMALPHGNDGFWNIAGAENGIKQLQALGRLVVVNRTPIDRPIDVSEFHRQIEEQPVFLPKASTLGMGYIVHMQQVWIPAGLSLGDLVYSLPLAPGEQQRIAIEERVQTVSERDIQTFSVDEFQSFKETQDSSALATFRSAFDEATRGGSHIDSSSQTGSVAAEASTGIVGAIFGGGGVSGGYSSSSSSGNTSSWQNTSRDFASNASQDMHSALTRVAAGSRRGSQTNIRVASETERTQVTTRIVTNHNKIHALTMQWWQVLRHFTVSSEVDDVQLVCFVPLELVQFLPQGEPFSLPGMPASRAALLARYAMVLRYHDVLAPFFRRNAEYAYGLRQLRDFAANPEAVPKTSTTQQDVVHFTIEGTFMPFEQVFVTVVCKSGAQIGPVGLTGGGSIVDLTPEKYGSRQELLGYLKSHRLPGGGLGIPGPGVTLQADIPLPDWLARTDIVRFDVTRRFSSLSYKLKLPPVTLANFAEVVQLSEHQTIYLSPAELEQEIGGPWVGAKSATLPGPVNFLAPDPFASIFRALMAGTLPLAALRVAPVLSFSDLLRIETVFHHIVRNTVFYSKAVWAALSDEERAILLERYTIGVPAGGVQSADQEVPLLNCVANRVLGFFGNAAIMPFGIPPDVAASMKVTSRDIQDALLRFHRQAFQPPRSSITLPARGTLGEAVLGSCSSAEKIDLTRFWNWQDSPSDQADAIPSSVFQPPQSIAAPAATGAGGPGVGGGSGSSGSVISINSGPPAATSSALLEALIKQSPDLAKELNLTGLDTLQKQVSADTQSAAAGRKEAIDSVTNIQIQAMKSAESIVKSVADAAAKAAPAAAGVPPVSGAGGGGGGGGGNG